MEHSATAVPKGLTVEEALQLAQQRWLRTPELCEILANPEILKILFASQRKDKPTNGAIFAIYEHRLPEFKDDGHVWAKKESHENLKDKGVVVLICKYVYGKIETNFKRRIYQMKREHRDIVLFHYRKDQNQENRKIWRRGTEVFMVTPQSIPETRNTGIVDHSSNRLPFPPQAANTGFVDHSSNQLPLPQQTANTSNLNIQENVESKGCSPDIVDHNSNQLSLPPQTATTSNLNIQGNVESTDSQQDTDAEFSSSYNSNSFTEDDMLHRDSEIEKQSIPQETNNDFFLNLAIPDSLSERMEYMEPSSEKNKKNPKRGIEILGEHPANRFGEVHMSYQQNPEWQKGWNNGKRCKMTNTSNLRNIQASAASGGCVPFEVTENDFPPKPGIPVLPYELPEQFPEFSFPEDSGNYIDDFESLLPPDECLISVMPFEWPEIDNSELFPELY